MKLWRIATETRRFSADDLSGSGAARSPGRWNDVEQKVVYAAPTIAMCVLETAAHIEGDGLPLNRYLVELEVPAALWKARTVRTADDLPPAWSAIPAGQASVEVGSKWLRSTRTAILQVPSVVVPEECVALINPLHPAAVTIAVTIVRRFEYAALYR